MCIGINLNKETCFASQAYMVSCEKENIMNEPRVYKQSPLLFIFMLLIFGMLFIGLVISMGRETWYIMLPFGLVFGVIFLVAIFSMTSKTTISDDEISTQTLLGTRTLRWSEINKVS